MRNPSKQGADLERLIKEANAKYETLGLAFVRKLHPEMRRIGILGKAPAFSPKAKTEADFYGFVKSSKEAVLIEAKSRLSKTTANQKTINVWKIPNADQQKNIRLAWEMGMTVYLVLETQLRDMTFPTIACFYYNGKEMKADPDTLLSYQCSYHKGVLDYLDLLKASCQHQSPSL